MSKYKAAEAYSVMQYQCDACGIIESVYNPRNAVTPFSFICRSCGNGPMRHINWQQDKRIPENFTVPDGALMFADHTPETALEAAKKRVASADGTPYELQGQEREEMIYSMTNEIMEDCCSCQIIRAGE